MSCKHGNHEGACDICDEVDAAYESGLAAGRAAPSVASGAQELPPLPPQKNLGAPGVYGWTAEQVQSYARAAIAAQAKPVDMSEADMLRGWEIVKDRGNFHSMAIPTDAAIIAYGSYILANSAPNKALVDKE
jgi:hypothetical protein